MDTQMRREAILNQLRQSKQALKGSELAKEYGVSRQVVVQDISILRAEGNDIIATPQGYQMIFLQQEGIFKKIVSEHHTLEELEDELYVIVDMGGAVLDVIVEHPLYGEIKAPLMLFSRKDVDHFVEKLQKTEAEPLSKLTDGIHMHTVQVRSETDFEDMKKALKAKNYLFQE